MTARPALLPDYPYFIGVLLDRPAELTERPGIVPAPYLARAKWVALEKYSALRKSEYERVLEASYDLVVAKLPKAKRPK